jgi:signal transduction histidine kinase/DNA-binding response OmpR family regulator
VSAKASILLVDDHPPNLMALEAILEPLGEQLVRASSGAEAVKLAAEMDLALVLLDLQMPELDGLETAALLKKIERARSVPIIIVTAYEPTRAELAQGYASGAVDFLYKPVDPDVLRSKVTVFVDLYRQRSIPPARASETRGIGRSDEPSGRLSERLLAAAAPAEDPAETVEAVMRIHSALSGDLDLEKIAQRLVDETCAFAHARGGAFHFDLRGSKRTAVSGTMREAVLALDGRSPVVRDAFEGRGVVRHSDVRHQGVRSLLAVPVLARGGEVDGALVLVDDRPGAFDARDEELAMLAAQHAAAALENGRLYEEAKEARHRAELAELELRAGEARLRLALESAGLGTWDFNPMTGGMRLDVRAKSLLGVEPGAPPGYATFIGAIHAEDRERVDRAVKSALDPAADGTFDIEFRTARAPGAGPRWIAAKGQAIGEQRRTVRFIGTVLDVTAKKVVEEERAALLAREREARAEAESASRAKDEFLATVSHELRNPLNAILGWSRVLLDEEDDFDVDRVRKGLDVIARNAKTQVQLVEDILEVSRIITGKLRLTTTRVDVRAAVETAVETVRSAAQAKGVVLETRFENAPRTIVADEDRVQQILWNLISNAVKFTARGGRIRVVAERRDDDVVFCVEDTGEGIERDFLPYVFDRFRQADGSTTRRHGGLGLGLAIVRHLVELHGGVVHAESGGKGRGATFLVRLPIRGTQHDETVPPPSTARSQTLSAKKIAAAPLEGRRVVVLDDEEDMRDLIAMILEHAGAVVTRVPDVETAVRAIEADPPDVAVSDLAMPVEDGYAFVRRVRALASPAARKLPLAAMTAYARAEDRHRVLDAGFDCHVAKPIEPAELVDALAALLGGSRRPGDGTDGA